MEIPKDVDTRDYFYGNYDELIPLVCIPYNPFLQIGASAVPKNTRSILDLGIGTGNFSVAVKEKLPDVKIYGIDTNLNTMQIAQEKVSDLTILHQDIFSAPLPQTDYIISSLTTHHFDNETRVEKLEEIARSSKGFVNIDLMLFNGNALYDVIKLLTENLRNYFPDEKFLKELEKQMMKTENPMELAMHKRIFESLGLEFKVLAKSEPWAVYHAFWPNTKE